MIYLQFTVLIQLYQMNNFVQKLQHPLFQKMTESVGVYRKPFILLVVHVSC
jgi:hypothetical protein